MVEGKEIRKKRVTGGGEAAEEIRKGSSGQVEVFLQQKEKHIVWS